MDGQQGSWKQGSEWTCRYVGGSSRGSMIVNGHILKLAEARKLWGSREVGAIQRVEGKGSCFKWIEEG